MVLGYFDQCGFDLMGCMLGQIEFLMAKVNYTKVLDLERW